VIPQKTAERHAFSSIGRNFEPIRFYNLCRSTVACTTKAIEVSLGPPLIAFITRQESHGGEITTIAHRSSPFAFCGRIGLHTGRNGLLKHGLMISGEGNGTLHESDGYSGGCRYRTVRPRPWIWIGTRGLSVRRV
jgi:hypothetical protein